MELTELSSCDISLTLSEEEKQGKKDGLEVSQAAVQLRKA